MNQAELAVMDGLLEQSIRLERFTAGERKKVLAILTELQRELKLKLYDGLTDFSKARVTRLLKESTIIIDNAYKGIQGELGISAPKMTKAEFERQAAFVHGTNTAGAEAIRRGEYDMAKRVFKFEPEGMFILTRNNEALAEIYAKQRAKEFGGEPVILRGDIRSGAKINVRDQANIIIDPKDFITYEKQVAESGGNLLGLARHEATATAQAFATIGLEAAIPTEAVLRALVNGSLIEGSPAAAWWAKQSDDLAFKFASQVRQGIVANETLMDIVRRVAGSPRLGIPGIMEVSRRNAGALVHTSIMQVANDARMAVYKANEDISKGYMHLSTLDGNICPVCVARSGAQWDLDLKPIGGTKVQFQSTPIHMRCRCLLLPILKSFKELGADIPEPPTGTRASDLGQIDAGTSFSDFLKRHDKNYQDDLLGPGRADMWRAGKISLSDLVSQNGRPLTLAQLRGKK